MTDAEAIIELAKLKSMATANHEGDRPKEALQRAINALTQMDNMRRQRDILESQLAGYTPGILKSAEHEKKILERYITEEENNG